MEVSAVVSPKEETPEEAEALEAEAPSEAPLPTFSAVEAEQIVGGEVELLVQKLPEKIHGKKVMSVYFANDLHQIVDVDRTTYSLPQSEFDLWKEGKLYVGV